MPSLLNTIHSPLTASALPGAGLRTAAPAAPRLEVAHRAERKAGVLCKQAPTLRGWQGLGMEKPGTQPVILHMGLFS